MRQLLAESKASEKHRVSPDVGVYVVLQCPDRCSAPRPVAVVEARTICLELANTLLSHDSRKYLNRGKLHVHVCDEAV